MVADLRVFCDTKLLGGCDWTPARRFGIEWFQTDKVDDCGVWRSLVARLTGGQKVVGSNPATPIGSKIDVSFIAETLF